MPAENQFLLENHLRNWCSTFSLLLDVGLHLTLVTQDIYDSSNTSREKIKVMKLTKAME